MAANQEKKVANRPRDIIDVQTLAQITQPQDDKNRTPSYQFSGARTFTQPGDQL